MGIYSTFDRRAFRWLVIGLHLAALLAFSVAVNHGFFDRVNLLVEAERFKTLAFYLGIWGISMGALLIAAMQPNRLVRVFWAFVISLSTAAAFGYRMISSSDLSVFDVLSLWTARHEAAIAVDFYRDAGIWSAVVFAACFGLITLVPVARNGTLNTILKWFGWAPAVPVALIAAIVMLKSGGGSQGMPGQFQPMAVAAVAGIKLATVDNPPRRHVGIKPGGAKPVSSIVLLVDESLRADYLDWTPGNPYTPGLAANRDRFINFGQAASGGTCSSYSNAILRMGPMRKDIPGTIRTNPTIWQYAKKAGFRTVYIDGQSGRIKDPSKLQNFMTTDEARFIDRHVTFASDVPTTELDDRVHAIIKEELTGEQMVFIYANREGAHFPYDKNYPAAKARFKPVMSETDNSMEARINSYRNVVSWSVDRLLSRLHLDLDLTDAAVIYTSDHGQNLPSHEMTHCSTANAHPREALVPLLAMTGNESLRARFTKGAELNWNKASHFAIAATLIELMGYAPEDISNHHDPSLFVASGEPVQRFTSGDIFGIFSKKVTWNSINLNVSHLEPEAMDSVAITENESGAKLKTTR